MYTIQADVFIYTTLIVCLRHESLYIWKSTSSRAFDLGKVSLLYMM